MIRKKRRIRRRRAGRSPDSERLQLFSRTIGTAADPMPLTLRQAANLLAAAAGVAR